MKRSSVFQLIAVVSLLAACTTPPNRVQPTSLTECGAIGSEVVRTEAEQQAAAKKRDGAWKNVIPFVVVGQYIEGKQDAEKAEERLTALNAQATQRGCVNNSASHATPGGNG